MKHRTDFLYLSEPDTIAAGVLNSARCVEVMEEVFTLLGKGDYVMGGMNKNSHGMQLFFPKESPFPNMPVAGPDRRFLTMPGYLGGRFNVCGNKWYGSNVANTEKGLPRSVLTMLLNDKETGEPLCFMSANLISAARTGAVPAVATRHLAKKNAKVCTVLGCGAINQACFSAIATQMQSLEKVVCYDLFTEKAQEFAQWVQENFKKDTLVPDSLEEAVRAGEVITVAASRIKPLIIEDTWVQKGAVVLLSGPMRANEAFWMNNTVVFDNPHMHDAYLADALASPDKHEYFTNALSGAVLALVDAGKLPPLSEAISLGDVILGTKGTRKSNEDTFVFFAGGMAVSDIAWGMEVYATALEKGIGQKLMLWDGPYQAT